MSSPRALVTGGGIRVGRAIALALADSGFDLVLHYRSSAGPVQEVAALVRAKGRAVTVVQADLATETGCAQVVEAAGRVDVVVHNAALYEAVPFAELSAQAWDRMQAVNCRAPALITRGLLAGLRASTRTGGGVVIHIGDIGGDRPAPGYAHYSVSKAGILMLTRALAVELAPAGWTLSSPRQRQLFLLFGYTDDTAETIPDMQTEELRVQMYHEENELRFWETLVPPEENQEGGA